MPWWTMNSAWQREGMFPAGIAQGIVRQVPYVWYTRILKTSIRQESRALTPTGVYVAERANSTALQSLSRRLRLKDAKYISRIETSISRLYVKGKA